MIQVTRSDLITLKSELKKHIEQRISVQTMLLLNAKIAGLKARRKKALDFCMNNDMHVESELLLAEIEALEDFRNRKI